MKKPYVSNPNKGGEDSTKEEKSKALKQKFIARRKTHLTVQIIIWIAPG